MLLSFPRPQSGDWITMRLRNPLRAFWNQRKLKRIRQRPKKTSIRRLTLEQMEDRMAPAVFAVNSLSDTLAVNLVTGVDSTGHITLRSAIQAANNLGGSNTINLPAGIITLDSEFAA